MVGRRALKIEMELWLGQEREGGVGKAGSRPWSKTTYQKISWRDVT